MDSFAIPRCYDSHLHLLATGQIAQTLNLSSLKSEAEVRDLEFTLENYHGSWLIGFGWDQNLWEEKKNPSKKILDQLFPETPVSFLRADGHAMWVNSCALQLAGIKGTGYLLDHEMSPVHAVLPKLSVSKKTDYIRAAIKILNKAGFTHVRDMGGDLEQWGILTELEKQNLLSLYVEQNFHLDSINKLASVIEDLLIAKKSRTQHLKAASIKFFYDGALGSEGALLSQNYRERNHSGQRLSSVEEMEFLFENCWAKDISVAVHALGDQASYEVACAALKVYQRGLRGELSIEHGEIIRPESIPILKKVKASVHLQPCHWLSDRRWLNEKVGELAQFAFPWKMLSDQQIKIYWGSDSPIETPSVWNNLRALSESANQGIPRFDGNPLGPHSYPDAGWGRDCHTQFYSENRCSVVFDGMPLDTKN